MNEDWPVVRRASGSAAEAAGHRPLQRATLLLAVVFNLGALALFKYAVFLQDNLNQVLGWLGTTQFRTVQIVLPIGISFYIFQATSYTVDVYRGVAPAARSLADFACYVSMFPQLVAGPIVRYNTVARQLLARDHTWERFASGVALFVLGFAKKILLANPIGLAADAAFNARQLTPIDAWFGAAAYAFQIYFDFSGYSDMAVGLGRIFGFELPANFNSPYLAESITDFWRRWHISLSTFLRDYLYIPLGGNRKGPRRTYVNLMIVMLLGGLWHGANWTFVAWGAYHSVLLAAERLLGKRSMYQWLPRPARIAATFLLVLFSWVLLRSASLADAAEYLRAMFTAGAGGQSALLLAAQLYARGPLLAMAACALLAFQRRQSQHWAERLDWCKAVLLAVTFSVSLVAMFSQSFNPFLYFQF